jgi:hypothetical protein
VSPSFACAIYIRLNAFALPLDFRPFPVLPSTILFRPFICWMGCEGKKSENKIRRENEVYLLWSKEREKDNILERSKLLMPY